MTDDLTLLREFAAGGAEDAFRTLVERHSGMVHGVAVRAAGEALAEEISQAVFVILAQKAASLRDGTVVGAWLYQTARFVALQAARREKRSKDRNEAFSMMHEQNESQALWRDVTLVLDAAIERLAEAERSAVVLRFFEGQTFADVAAELGISEGAAKMRVGRALEKLRTSLPRKGIVTSASAMGVSLAAHGASAAPTGLTSAVTTAAVAQGNAGASVSVLIKGGLKAMAVSKAKTAALAVLPLLLLCGGAYGVYEAARPKPKVATFEPMAGEWEGKIELRGDDVPAGPLRPAALRVRTSDQGRTCEIEMRAADDGGGEQRFHFTHRVDESGRNIATTDDPQIGLLNGPGQVTLGGTNELGEWKAGFRTKHATGRSDCEWRVNGSELKIVRHDLLAMDGGKVNRYSIVDLRRKQD